MIELEIALPHSSNSFSPRYHLVGERRFMPPSLSSCKTSTAQARPTVDVPRINTKRQEKEATVELLRL